MADDLNARLSETTSLLGLGVWEVIGICVGFFIFIILSVLIVCLFARKNRRRSPTTDDDHHDELPVIQIPVVSKEIEVVRAADDFSNEESKKTKNGYSHSRSHSCESLEEGNNGRDSSFHLGWGYWFTLRDLQLATDHFSKKNILGEGGYGVVYRGNLTDATPVAVKKLLNDMGQAQKEFRVEVEAIGHVRHKNLVRLLGYCIEGTHRMLVYEYVDNGNLEQCLHAPMQNRSFLTWDDRIKILLGTAKGISYLHEAIEPKVIHRDIKSSNILIDREFNAKVSDFGLAKLLGSGTSHIATRVMGTFGYVAPEYANTGLLNEKSDVYSFGIVLLEAITGRNPVDHGRPAHEVNLVDWLKRMIANRRAEEVVDPKIAVRPPSKSLKMALLTALKCVDPDPEKRPRMSRAVQMLENENHQIRFDR